MGSRAYAKFRAKENRHRPGQSGLGHVALLLNGLRDPAAFDPERRAAWAAVEKVLGALVRDPQARPGKSIATQVPSPEPRWALASFNRLAKKAPVPLMVKPLLDKKGDLTDTVPLFRPVNPAQETVWLLWRYVFTGKGWLRLRRCRTCRAWFEDRTKNRSREFCSIGCLNRFWNRSRRQDARERALKGKGKARVIWERLNRQETRAKAKKRSAA